MTQEWGEVKLRHLTARHLFAIPVSFFQVNGRKSHSKSDWKHLRWLLSTEGEIVSVWQQEYTSRTEQIIGKDESSAVSTGLYFTFHIDNGLWIQNVKCHLPHSVTKGDMERKWELTWVSLRGRSSAACYRGWLSWCKRLGSQKSLTPLCSAPPGPVGKPREQV